MDKIGSIFKDRRIFIGITVIIAGSAIIIYQYLRRNKDTSSNYESNVINDDIKDDMKDEMKVETYSTWIFGYGSLISEKSRKLSSDNIYEYTAARLKNYKRYWDPLPFPGFVYVQNI